MSDDRLDIEELLNKRDAEEFLRMQEQKQRDFFDLHVTVREYMGWTDIEVKDWFYKKNPRIGNFTPLDYYGKRPDKCAKWIYSLIDESGPL